MPPDFKRYLTLTAEVQDSESIEINQLSFLAKIA
jgi:hypothetical protein